MMVRKRRVDVGELVMDAVEKCELFWRVDVGDGRWWMASDSRLSRGPS